jgi:NitT/TauT family transport system permease protein
MVEAADVYGVEGKSRWRILLLPAVFPALVTGLITAAGGAWNASIVSEFVKVQGKELVAPGLGSAIYQATDAGNFGRLAAGTMVMSAALVLINRLFWKRLFRLADNRFALNR